MEKMINGLLSDSFYLSLMSSASLTGIIVGVICCILFLPLGYIVRIVVQRSKTGKSEKTAANIIQEAVNEAKSVKKETLLEAKDEALRIRTELDSEIKERRFEIQKSESRIIQREDILNKKEDTIDKKLDNIEKTQEELHNKESNLNKLISEQSELKEKIIVELEKASKMTKEEAKKKLIIELEDKAKEEAAILVRTIEQEAKEEANKKSKEIITLAIQKCAADHTSEVTVSSVALPNDEMKGRIIGREGRNIRALESATGVDLIIDDTPDTVILSSFDPIRREVARLSLEKLILDGRIHPTRIEEMVEKVRKELDQTMKEAGENALFEIGIHNMHPELTKLLGRLKYRTSYGQNVLKHSIEVSLLAGLMATEIGANVNIAKRGGLLHDIGKAVDHEVEGTHISIGIELAAKYKESKDVVHCIHAHHGDVPFESIEAVLVQAADAISSSRPGARRESLESYIKRLQQLEKLANEFKGVEKSFAIQAGREVRIIVRPDEISDEKALFLAKDIAQKIEKEMDYPGQIKVNVIRETRNVEYAK